MIELSRDQSGLGDLARRRVVYADQAALPAYRVLEDYPSRTTALLRLAAGAGLPIDPERRGVEILVVEGEIAFDGVTLRQYGYARCPQGAAAIEAKGADTLVFVKRGHIPPEEIADTVTVPHITMWQVDPASGLPVLPLHRQGSVAVMLRRYQAGDAPVTHRPPKGEEMLVLEGTLLDERSAYARGSWIRHPAGSLYQPYSLEGCLVYAQSGHLPAI